MTFDKVIAKLSTEEIAVKYLPTNWRRRLFDSGTPYGCYKIKSPSLGSVTIRVRYDEDMDFPHTDEIIISGPKLPDTMYAWDSLDKYKGEKSFQNGITFIKTLTWSSRLRDRLYSCSKWDR